MSFLSVCGLCLFCLVAVLILRYLREEYARFLSAVACCLFIPVGLAYLKEYGEHFSVLAEKSGLFPYAELLFKAVGIAFLGSTVSSLCKDCAELSLGEKLQFCTRCSILALSLPVVKDLTEQVMGLL